MVARRLGLVVVCVVIGVFGLVVSPAFAFVTRPYEESFGLDGVAGSKFTEERPGALAIDQATGSIYVGDGYFDQSVSKFNVAHEPEPFSGLAPYIVGGRLTGFGFMWQFAVDSVSHVLYVADGSPVRAFQSDGEPANFTAGPAVGTNELPGSEVCGVTVDSSGEIYVSEFGGGIHVYASSGEPLTSIPVSGVCNLAVDSNGVVYANQHPEQSRGQSGPVEKLVPSGPPPVSSSTTYEPPVTVDENASFTLTVDPTTDHVLVDEGPQIAEYDQAGTRLGTFGATEPGMLLGTQGLGVGIAVNGVSGRVYVGQGNFEGQVEVFGPAVTVPDVTTEPASGIDPKGSATLNGTVKPDGIALTQCQFEYVEATRYEPLAADPYAAGGTAQCESPAAGEIATAGETSVSARVTGLNPGGTYHFRLKAANNNGPNYGADASLELPPLPAIGGATATNVTASTADLNARIDPGSLHTTYHFEYDTTVYKSGEAEHVHGRSVGVGELAAGAGDVTIGPVHITELHHDVTYHWRVVATNDAGTTFGADHTFVYDTTGEVLPDNRAYEMVSPPQKNGALIGDVFFAPLPDISEDGSRLILSSIQCFAGSLSCTAGRQSNGEQFLFSRTSTGWVTTALAPPATRFEANSSWMVSAETGMELFSMPTAPPLGNNEDDFYMRETDGSFVDIGPATPPSAGALGELPPWGPFRLGATSDFSRVVYQERHAWAWPFDESGGGSTYEFSGSGNAAPVLVGVTGGLGSTDLISKCQTVFGAGLSSNNLGMMSANGETVFFTATRCNEGVPVPADEVFARVGEARTVAISEPSAFSPAAPYSGCTGEPCVNDVNDSTNWRDALFVGASNDGSKVFFTSNQRLTDSASGESNLYEYDSDRSAEEGHVIDVSAGDTSGHGSRVQGVVAVSPDGSHVYFVAKGVLTKEANQQGVSAQVGANNLYVFNLKKGDAQGKLAFIAQLPETDSAQWTNNGAEGLANVTLDGRFLVFESSGGLTADATRTDGAIQIFRYDAQTGVLARISIGEHGFNDNGNAGSGDAKIVQAFKGWSRAGAARADPTMSHDGSFVFFRSPVGLTPFAVNDVQINPPGGEASYAENIYEWHDGHVHLISDGKDTAYFGESAVTLIGSDATGANVFFSTADPLVSQDTDSQLDYYDARVCSNVDPCVSQPPPSLPPCLGEACHGTPAAQVGSPSSGTLTFNGQGNVSGPSAKSVKAKKKKRVVKCAKGKRRIHGRCVKVKARGGKAKSRSHRGGK